MSRLACLAVVEVHGAIRHDGAVVEYVHGVLERVPDGGHQCNGVLATIHHDTKDAIWFGGGDELQARTGAACAIAVLDVDIAVPISNGFDQSPECR
jgi:hypothetical protein